MRFGRAWRRERPPAEVLGLLERGERVTGWAELAGGGVAVATRLGLWLPADRGYAHRGVADRGDVGRDNADRGHADRGDADQDNADQDDTEQGDAGPGYRRTPWHLVDKAAWDPPRLVLTVAAEGDPVGDAAALEEAPPRAFPLAVPRNLPGEVRARVTRSVWHSSHHAVAPRGGVWLVARRVSGRDGLAWQVRFDAGTDPGDPLVREQVSRLLATARQAHAPLG
jgi:hypothetical protein